MKICLTTFIFGDTYQNYIPLILYSVSKSYPEYCVKIFINGDLRSDIKEILKIISRYYNNFSIIENTFDDCKQMTPLKARSLRWVLWDESFREFDYLYYIDSDILFMREPMDLHEQHIVHMKSIQSDCVSNILRKKDLKNSDLYLFLSAVKHGGLLSLVRYPFVPFEYRMSGLHFVKVCTYFKYLTPDKLNTIKYDIYSGRAFKGLLYANDETLLYHIMKNAGCDMHHFAVQKDSTSMFGFSNPLKREFCPHHGIHLGIFRIPHFDSTEWTIEQLESDDYKYYIEMFKRCWLNDLDFKELYPLLPQQLKNTFNLLFGYYNITPTFSIL